MTNSPIRMAIYDISMPIWNGMWSYRKEWANEISNLASTIDGDASTAYRFNVCSHTGTYIETCQHKLPTPCLLSDFSLTKFVRECTLVCISNIDAFGQITVSKFADELEKTGGLAENDALIIATGWGQHCRASDFMKACPSFEPELTDFLADLQLDLLGVDTPVIDNQNEPYDAVKRLFNRNANLLLLAPLVINTAELKTGRYTLSALPLNVEGTSASLCRAVLMENTQL